MPMAGVAMRYLGFTFRTVLKNLKDGLGQLREQLPRIAAAVDALETAIDLELPRQGIERGHGKPPSAKGDPVGVIKRRRNHNSYLRRKNKKLEEVALKCAVGKGTGSPICFAKVALADPLSNARAWARSLRDLHVESAGWMHRKNIGRVRDAFVGSAKSHMDASAGAQVAEGYRLQREVALASRCDFPVARQQRAPAGRSTWPLCCSTSRTRRPCDSAPSPSTTLPSRCGVASRQYSSTLFGCTATSPKGTRYLWSSTP